MNRDQNGKALIQDLIFITAPIVLMSTDENGKITLVNPAVQNVFGYYEGEVTGKDLSMLIPELETIQYDEFSIVTSRGDFEFFVDLSGEEEASETENESSRPSSYIERFIRGYVKNGKKGEIETKNRHGETIWIDLSINKIKSADKDMYGVIISDITHLKNTESELRRINETLDELVKKRTRELEEIQKELVEQAHRAGQSDIAVNVLHNAGNTLNSLIVSGRLIKSTLQESKLSDLTKANALLRKNLDRIEDFITHDPKGKKLLQYYLILEESLTHERETMIGNADRLVSKAEDIVNVIIAQRNYVSEDFLAEEVNITDVIDDVLLIHFISLTDQQIRIRKSYSEVPAVTIQKKKCMQVLTDLIKNAKEAMVETEPDQRILGISVDEDEGNIRVSVEDTGCGIEPDNHQKVFFQGYTTKQGALGYGLHRCANFMGEMGGKMQLESEGAGKGATFSLIFPSG